MILSYGKINVLLARAGKSLSSLRDDRISPYTLRKIVKGEPILPKTAGKVARALGVDIAEIADNG